MSGRTEGGAPRAGADELAPSVAFGDISPSSPDDREAIAVGWWQMADIS
jgi:hypothetical protein